MLGIALFGSRDLISCTFGFFAGGLLLERHASLGAGVANRTVFLLRPLPREGDVTGVTLPWPLRDPGAMNAASALCSVALYSVFKAGLHGQLLSLKQDTEEVCQEETRQQTLRMRT